MISELANRSCTHAVSRTTDVAVYIAAVKDTPWDRPYIDKAKNNNKVFIYSFSIEELSHEDEEEV